MKLTALFWTLRVGIGVLFAYTGVVKIIDPTTFAAEIHNYQILAALAPFGAATLPAIELVLGVTLIAGTRPWVRAAALATGALMLIFTMAVIAVLTRGINISCGCFGTGSGPVTLLTVARDILLVAVCGAVYALAAPKPAPALAVDS